MKTFLFRSMIGIFFGAFISVVFTSGVVLFSDKETLNGALFLKNSLGSIFCGWLFTVTPLYFENKRFTMMQATGFHFLTVFVAYFILAFFIGWIPFTLLSFGIGLAIFIVVYILHWLAFYYYFRLQAKKLNENLNSISE
ncbi:DUF3021 domain-containing protein [Psychrobacillus sp. FSL W7-1457]|uniref:DUF3021 domain-containing protein n=1 Tax=unclassified Psychrobacillus TaxID=2636677 RepID=UPI0030F7D744